jgi:hypothetical protein
MGTVEQGRQAALLMYGYIIYLYSYMRPIVLQASMPRHGGVEFCIVMGTGVDIRLRLNCVLYILGDQ